MTTRGRLRLQVDLQVASRSRRLPTLGKVRRWIRSTLSAARGKRSIGVRVVDRAESRRLNSTYRSRNHATNVLSFPAPERQPAGERLLGDLVICAPVVTEEAREQGKPIDAHWAHLVVHGTLHLLGHDHERPKAARAMEAREIRILAGLGYSNPYRI
ncbi:MAG TPA: rRNA maturation RNase YbeY [Steroidobacteraceae bacterium]|nr:rRNA maturation RNase YbeY [Steroidobacteraceae bacterium]